MNGDNVRMPTERKVSFGAKGEPQSDYSGDEIVEIDTSLGNIEVYVATEHVDCWPSKGDSAVVTDPEWDQPYCGWVDDIASDDDVYAAVIE